MKRQYIGAVHDEEARRARRERARASVQQEYEKHEGMAMDLQEGDFLDAVGDGNEFRRYKFQARVMSTALVGRASVDLTVEMDFKRHTYRMLRTYPVRYRRPKEDQ